MAIPETTASTPETARPRIGVPGIVFFVVAASAPLTVAAGGMPTALAVTGVVGTPLLYVFLAVLLTLFTGGYAAMSRWISNAGAFYSYVTHGLGRVAGVGTAFIALLAYNTMQIGLYGLFGFVVADFVKTKTGLAPPWWLIGLVALAVIAVLGYRRIDLNAKVLGVLLVIESLAVLIFDIGQLGGAPEGISAAPLTFGSLGDGAIGAALCFAMAAFMGFEAAAIYSEEVKDPRRTVGRATYVAVGLIGIFYAFTAWAMVLGAGPAHVIARAQKETTGMLFTLAAQHVGAVFADVAQVFLITSVFAAMLSFHNAVARYFFSLGREGVLPGRLGRTHTRHRSPHVGSVTQTVLAAAAVVIFTLTGQDPLLTLFTWFTNLGALGVIFLLALISVAVVGYFARDPRGEHVWNRLIAPIVSGAGLAFVFVLALLNFGALLGAAQGSVLTWVLPGLIFVFGAAGVGYGLWLRGARGEVYGRIGQGE